ncbi:uncharacterized protein GGS22DRAFT_107432 [Annulohypoxylon maeteangense]|uniref:uncharacterized protein n=1 Tax=Annulohypoxylon maeteangense TaxID=1927788 RepID=UPI002008BF29|nr:uncharacterized protein GGS22DRAFT_107432 [Annulohypoxylon maeteangense]KAI0887297.1 hypothetical protein GGS22DRAFT_107432 [Annulohypoxylon maeteangense]
MKKRIVVCCDGTWQNSDNGYVQPTSSNPLPTLQIPSNVTRISRTFKRTCSDGTFQIVYYQSGVGSRSGPINRILGGAFGIGIAENIREAYAYICANYVDGDEIVLIGFSRGAFTARSIGGMISDLGLLTREGMEFFYPVFKDMQNWMNPKYKDQFPQIPFPGKPKGPHARDDYRKMLVEKGYTRVRQDKGKGDLIRIKAIGVWDTVGALGIPQGKPREILARLGIKMPNQEYRFYNTNLSNKIEHGFHALALDETRGPFSPTLWEQQPDDRDTSDLRQVWFPGSHGNIGGGWKDQGVANITLAWMMDQLSSIGCEFVPDAIEQFYDRNVQFYHSLQLEQSKRQKYTEGCRGCCGCASTKVPLLWATKSIFDTNKPIRPWGLHSIRSVSSPIYDLVGSVTRSPGLYKKVNPDNGSPRRAFLKDTNERIHSSVRVRLACEGLGLNDSNLWECPALLQSWRPRHVPNNFDAPIPPDASWGPQSDGGVRRGLADNENATVGDAIDRGGTSSTTIRGPAKNGNDATKPADNAPGNLRWVWEYIGPDKNAPYNRTLAEETMGPWEKHLLTLSTGKLGVYDYAEAQEVAKFRILNTKKFMKRLKSKSKK